MNDKKLAQLTIQIQDASNYRGLRYTLINELIPYWKETGLGVRYPILTRNKPLYRFNPCYILWFYKIMDLKCGGIAADEWLERNYSHLHPHKKYAFDIWSWVYNLAKKDAEDVS